MRVHSALPKLQGAPGHPVRAQGHLQFPSYSAQAWVEERQERGERLEKHLFVLAAVLAVGHMLGRGALVLARALDVEYGALRGKSDAALVSRACTKGVGPIRRCA